MNISQIKNITQLKNINSVLRPVLEESTAKTIKERYKIIESIALKFGYSKKTITKKDRKEIINLCVQSTGLSRDRVKHLLTTYVKNKGRIVYQKGNKNTFRTKYTSFDIARLLETDNALRRMSGNATVHVFARMYDVYGDKRYEQLSNLSVSHLYNLRETRQYQSQSLTISGTRSVTVPIGKRKKPETLGKPGFLRVDSVHQGDLGKIKGVYYINLVDEVTQWEIIACVPNIGEKSMEYVLEGCIALFPFKILNFHSDNGGEYINYTVAELLKKVKVKQTKNRSRKTTDNSLVEGKNVIIRKHFGHGHIPKKHAQVIHEYLNEWFNIFLNFHRPCAFSTDTVDQKTGKVKKKYDTWMTPLEKLKSIQNVEQYLKADVSIEGLTSIERECDDVTFAILKEKKREELFKKLS